MNDLPSYRQAAPHPALGQYVESFWSLQSDAISDAPEERIVPDGCMEIIFNLADPMLRQRANGIAELQPKTIVVGQTRGCVTIRPKGRVDLFGVRFQPAGAVAFLRCPAKDLTDRILSLDLIWSSSGVRELTQRIQEAGSFPDRIRIIEGVLRQRISSRTGPDPVVAELVSRILNTCGRRPLHRLTRDLGVSSRSLERRFDSQVGLSPKLFSRIIRFQRIFAAYEHRFENWTSMALDCGYYDQAHLIRDFRQFSGQNPSAYFVHESLIAPHLTRKNRLSDFYNTED